MVSLFVIVHSYNWHKQGTINEVVTISFENSVSIFDFAVRGYENEVMAFWGHIIFPVKCVKCGTGVITYLRYGGGQHKKMLDFFQKRATLQVSYILPL